MPIPFPVSREYRIRSNVAPLSRSERPDGQPEGGLFDPGDDWEVYLNAKLKALSGDTPCRRIAADPAQFARQLEVLMRVIAKESPDRLTFDGRRLLLPHLGVELDVDRERGAARLVSCETRNVADHLSSLTPEQTLVDAIALAIEEDFVLLVGPEPGVPDRAQIMHVCLPSGWSAKDKAGQDFATIHQPVPHHEPLMKAHAGLVTAMIHRGPFVRYVWGLHRDGELCHDPYVHIQPPERHAPTAQAAVDATWFRVERQTTLGLPEMNSAFFFIRVYQCPLAEAITSSERALRMASALRDMTPEIAEYKGVSQRRHSLIHWLNRFALS